MEQEKEKLGDRLLVPPLPAEQGDRCKKQLREPPMQGSAPVDYRGVLPLAGPGSGVPRSQPTCTEDQRKRREKGLPGGGGAWPVAFSFLPLLDRLCKPRCDQHVACCYSMHWINTFVVIRRAGQCDHPRRHPPFCSILLCSSRSLFWPRENRLTIYYISQRPGGKGGPAGG